ncbi:MAG TPA: hypothetical protein VLU47_07265, partial [Blastocatellia bacterium]|nr:hypothetical protein [Blastocatellia bacterium]
MKTPQTRMKTPISLILTFALATLFVTPVVIARVNDPDLAENLPVVQVPTGMLTVKGPVLLNGNEAKTGMTVLDGSVIQTRTAGEAIIDMGAIGQVIVHGFSAITLKMSPNSVDIDLNKCGKGVTVTVPPNVPAVVRILHEGKVGIFSDDREIDVKVKKGQVLVKYEADKEKILDAVDHHDFDGVKQVSATGDAVFKVYCDEKEFPILFFIPVAAIIFPVTELIGDEPVQPVVSPTQP